MVIHSRQVWFNGYRAENERTFFVGKPAEKQIDLLKLAIEAQQVGMDLIRTGITASEVDIASYEIFKKAGYSEYVNHRIGHGLGLSEHEENHTCVLIMTWFWKNEWSIRLNQVFLFPA